MIKTILSTLILATVSLTASAEYTIKVPLEVSKGGTLPNGSINFVAVAPAPTLVSSENVCENSATYDAATLYVTQTRNYTRTCKDVALYSDNSTVESNETVDNLSVTGIKNHFAYFTTQLNFKLQGASIETSAVSPAQNYVNLYAKTSILTTQHKAYFEGLFFRDMPSLYNSRFLIRITGNRTIYNNSIKDLVITTNTGIVRSCVGGVSWFYDSSLFATEIRCILSEPILNHATALTTTTTGSVKFILAD